MITRACCPGLPSRRRGAGTAVPSCSPQFGAAVAEIPHPRLPRGRHKVVPLPGPSQRTFMLPFWSIFGHGDPTSWPTRSTGIPWPWCYGPILSSRSSLSTCSSPNSTNLRPEKAPNSVKVSGGFYAYTYPVPAPLNLITGVYDLIRHVVSALYRGATHCCSTKKKPIEPQSSSQPATAMCEGRTSTAPRSPSGSSRRVTIAADTPDGSSLKTKGSEAEPTSRLQSALVRRSTRVHLLMRDKDEAEKAAGLSHQ